MGLFGFGKKRPLSDRYDGKPFLKLVDSFVLKCIEELDPSQENLLHEMTPTLQETYENSGSWDEIVIAQMQFPPDIRMEIQDMWVKNQTIAKQNGLSLAPMQFVEMFVRDNIGEM